MRIGTGVLIIWLLIGVLAANQRHWYDKTEGNDCSKALNSGISIVAGPLNYVGVHPNVGCKVPQPS